MTMMLSAEVCLAEAAEMDRIAGLSAGHELNYRSLADSWRHLAEQALRQAARSDDSMQK